MAYIPESKINKLNTPGGEFIIKSTNQGYVGDYIELSNGKFYVGNDPKQLNEELIIPPSTNRLGNNRNSRLYSNLKPQTTKFQTQVKSVYPSKSIPTDKDYTRGYYTRYFARKVNEPRGYMEVDVDIFNSISQRKKTHDYNLYEVGSLTWNLKNGTTTSNSINLQILERTFPFVSIIFPKLDEFEKIDNILTTPGGELYYEDGREYIGLYHVHPEKGPMVGAEHINEPHAFLNYSEELSSLTDNIDRTIPIPSPTPSVEVKQPSQTPLRSMLQDRTTTTRSTPSIRRTPTRRSGY